MHRCHTCEKVFTTKRALYRHNKCPSHTMRQSNTGKLYTCTCGKSFTQGSNLSRHKGTCKIVSEKIHTKDDINTQITQLKEQFEKEKEEMQSKIDSLMKQSDKHKKKRTTTTHTHTTTNHNHITININPFGKEDLSPITFESYLYCLNRVCSSCPALANAVYSIPQNKNVNMPNKKQPYVAIQTEYGEKLAFLDEALDQIEVFCYTLLEEKFTDPTYRDKMTASKKKAFEAYIESYGSDPKGTIRKNIRNALKLMILNMTERK